MIGPLFLALRYLAAGPFRTATLVGGIAIALFLPALTWTAAGRVEASLLERARSSPVLVGHKGNELDLTMSALYFRGAVRDPIPAGTSHRTESYGTSIPLVVRHSAGGVPIVGTSLDYFDARGLTATRGRLPAVLGEVVAGASAARAFGLTPGDTVRSDLSDLYDLVGSYPLQLEVSGVLAATGTPDDEVFFTDVKTTWALDGALHGHAAVDGSDATSDDGETVEATAAIFMLTEIDAANLASFHLHGDPDDQPITALLVLPRDERARDQLLGDFALDPLLRSVQPELVVEGVIAILLRARDALFAWFALVAASTTAFTGLVVTLSLRLRRTELALLRRIGASRSRVAATVAAELVAVLLVACAIAGLLTWLGAALVEAALL